MSERERFEAWARTQPRHEGANMRFLPLNNAYIDFDLHGAWLAWQAARSGQAASGSQENARSDVRTGWPPGLLQDDSRELSRALASKPDAMVHARDAVAKIGQPEAPNAPLGWKLVPTDPSNAMLLPIVRAFKCGHAEAWKALSEAIAAHPPARSGAGSEEGQG